MRSLFALVLCCLLSRQASSETIHVPVGGDIQSALDSAANGDLIRLDPGLYPIASTLRFPAEKGLTLRGAEPSSTGEPRTLLDGDDAVQVITLQGASPSETILADLVIQGGRSGGGDDGQSDLGGGMRVTGPGQEVEFLNCVFQSNISSARGGGLAVGGCPHVRVDVRCELHCE